MLREMLLLEVLLVTLLVLLLNIRLRKPTQRLTLLDAMGCESLWRARIRSCN